MQTEAFSYNPVVADEAEPALPQELIRLRETLAEHVHDVWAAGRLKEGWRYGPVHDEKARTHPDLVPYDALPETEKEYDRRTAAAVIRCMLTHGYRVEKETEELRERAVLLDK